MSDSDESTVTYHKRCPVRLEGLSDIGHSGVVGSETRDAWMLDGPNVQDEVFPAEEQPLPAAASPTAQSPDYVPESDPEEIQRRIMDVDLRRISIAYPGRGGDDGDD
ncbi:hypothetical protein Tco_0294985 [Tanacetum coccineum]